MTQAKVSWLEQGASVLDLSPFEALQASTTLVAQRPSDEPWLALVTPTSKDVSSFSVSLSLDAYNLFSPEVISGFSGAAENLLRRCTQEEISAMASQEKEKGNPGNLWLANEGILRLFVPSRLLEQAKSAIERLFREATSIVVNTPD